MNLAEIKEVAQTMQRGERAPASKVEMFRQMIIVGIENDPLFRRYVASRPLRHILPWHALAARLVAARSCVEAASNKDMAIYGLAEDIPDWARDQIFLLVAFKIVGAIPYLWSDEAGKIAGAAPLPKHIVSKQLLPGNALFWCHETARSDGENDSLWNVLLRTAEDTVDVIGDVHATNKPENDLKSWGIVIQDFKLGITWPDDYGDPQFVEATGMLLKSLAFLASPYVDPNPVRMPRPQRRQLEREGLSPEKANERTHVVKLRREVKKPNKTNSLNGEGIEWQHQWWVSGHFRAQWYATEEAHRVIWIGPYLKGPQDKPLLDKLYAVVR